MVQLLELLPPIKVLRVEPLESLCLQGPYDVVVVAELVTKHGVRILNRRRRLRDPILPDVFMREQVDVLGRW